MGLKYVKKRDGTTVKFNTDKIKNAVLKAASAVDLDDENIGEIITQEVTSYLKIFFGEKGIPEVEQIQDLVEKVLIEKGYAEVAKAYILYREQHKKIRDTKKLFNDAIDAMNDYLDLEDWKVKENSNMGYSLQGLNNFISSEVTSQYWLQEVYPPEAGERHLDGDFHIHDLGNLSVYCCGWDLEDFLKTGFRGVSTKIESKPPKHLKTALGQMVNFFFTLQGEAAGAMAFSNFDTLLAPYIAYDDLEYKEVKQAMQEFLFNMNVPTRVGFQTPFTNITMDLTVPNHYKDSPVFIGGEMKDRTYGEFQKEMDLINKAFAEVMMSGDSKGRVFSFPIPTYNITPDFDWNKPLLNPVWEMTAKYGIPYFCLDEDTELITDKGIKQIKNLRINEDKVLGENGKFYSVNNYIKNTHSEYIEITTENEKIIRCSKNHRFPTQNGIKKAVNLSINDQLKEYNKKIIFKNGFELSYKNQSYFNLFNQKGKEINIKDVDKNSKDQFYCLQPNPKDKIDKDKQSLSEFEKDHGGHRNNNSFKDKKSKDCIYLFIKKIIENNNYVSISSLKRVEKEINTVDITVDNKSHLFLLANEILTHNSNFVNSDMDPEDARSMCLYPDETILIRYQNEIKKYTIGKLFDQFKGENIDDEWYQTNKKVEVISLNPDTGKLEWADVNKFLKVTGDKLITITTKDGKTMKISKDHLVAVYEKNGITTKKAMDIDEKDLLLVMRSDSEILNKDSDKEDTRVIKTQHDFKTGNMQKQVVKDKLYNMSPQFLVEEDSLNEKGNKPNQVNEYKTIGLSTIDKLELSNHKVDFLNRPDYDVVELDEINVESLNHEQEFYDIELKENHYFVHSDNNISHNCCRLRLDNRELRKRGGGLFGANPMTGSIGVVTLNMPRIGYISKNKNDYLERVFQLMDLAKESLEIKRTILESLTEQGLYPYSRFYLRNIKKRFDEYWKNHFNTIGINGMNESLINFMGKNLSDKAAKDFAVEVMESMKTRMKNYQEETGNLYNLEATPAESTSYRLARLDKEKYGVNIKAANEKRIAENGAEPYYTNSTHLPVGYTEDIFDALEIQDELQTEYTGGTVFHGFLGERLNGIESTKKLVKRISSKFKLPYYTITPTFSICPIHGYLPGEHRYCPKCEAEERAREVE